ncbi:TPA: hypothetical protein QH041_003098 [Legionella pneumophila]|nr:hypothetical protein [Legionella pneumophila]HDS3863207.1 hypothetical protein [Legionella pneumophila]
MDNAIAITDEHLNELRQQLHEHKKRNEYVQLKRDLFDITFQANHALTEFDGGMKQVDTERALSPHRKQTISDLIIARFIKMCALRPVIGNLIAVTLALVAIASLHAFLHNPELNSLKTYLSYFIELAAGIQVLKSASRSLVLPLCATIIGVIISSQLTGNHLFLKHTSEFYQAVLVTGLVGIAISVFSID